VKSRARKLSPRQAVRREQCCCWERARCELACPSIEETENQISRVSSEIHHDAAAVNWRTHSHLYPVACENVGPRGASDQDEVIARH